MLKMHSNLKKEALRVDIYAIACKELHILLTLPLREGLESAVIQLSLLERNQ
jgi:hypothetical protein